MDHYTLLFVSNLAPTGSPGTITGIARQARANNVQTDITGLLVFDGAHLAQLMEGPEQAVLEVADRMTRDSRHEHMEVLYSEPNPRPKRFPEWRLGYLVLDLQEFGPRHLRGKRGHGSVQFHVAHVGYGHG